jgi:hypothetical protein
LGHQDRWQRRVFDAPRERPGLLKAVERPAVADDAAVRTRRERRLDVSDAAGERGAADQPP